MKNFEMLFGALRWTSFRWRCMSTNHCSGVSHGWRVSFSGHLCFWAEKETIPDLETSSPPPSMSFACAQHSQPVLPLAKPPVKPEVSGPATRSSPLDPSCSTEPRSKLHMFPWTWLVSPLVILTEPHTEEKDKTRSPNGGPPKWWWLITPVDKPPGLTQICAYIYIYIYMYKHMYISKYIQSS